MRRWTRIACALALASAVAGCGRKAPELRVDPIGHAPQLAATAIALANAPTARTVRCVGERAESFRGLFATCGFAVVSNASSAADVLFLAPAPEEALPVSPEDLAGAPVVIERLDVRGMTAPALERRLRPYAGRAATLWMPGEHDWFVVARATTNAVAFADMTEAFGREGVAPLLGEVGCDAVTEVFASCVGAVDDVLPAFRANLAGDVLPQWFVTREVPSFGWIGFAGVDDRIRPRALGEIRSRQNVRRQVLQANEKSLRGDEDAAIEGWAKALRLNPCEPLLLERLGVLGVNARTFRSLGKLNLAAKCYETMARICPADPYPIEELAACLDALGKPDLAKAARERARALRRRSGACRTDDR